ncbi:MAG: hypothetical protein ACRD26_14520 [Vicinamibacterales bacterium]
MTGRAVVLIVLSSVFVSTSAAAQAPGPQPRVASPPSPASNRPGIRGVFEAGASWLAATASFETITGEVRTTQIGGGVQVTNVWRRVFVQVDVSRATATGERVFLHEGTAYPLGIPVEITTMPIEASAGYRFPIARGRLIAYGGGGGGMLAYREESPFGVEGERVDERFRSWHLLGGLEVPIVRWIAAGAEVHVRFVPNAIGAAGVSAIFQEHDLGGTTLRLRVTVGT